LYKADADAGMYVVGHMSYVQILNVTFCDNENEALEVRGPFSHLEVEGSHFLAECSGRKYTGRKIHRSKNTSSV
jgi:hypothetical protein